MERLILREYLISFLIGLMSVGLALMAFLKLDKDILFGVGALFAPIMLLLAKGLIDSDETNEEKE